MVPLPSRTLTLPPEEQNNSHLTRHNHVSRQISRISSRSIGSPIDPAARLPVEFRTLSLHVDETARQEAAEKRKGAAKGKHILVQSFRLLNHWHRPLGSHIPHPD
jgi:hypothetical protein